MKTKDFLKKHDACSAGARWALSVSDDMADVWEALIEQGEHAWLIWTLSRPGVFPESVLRKMACRFIRETPLSDGRTVWDMLTDERSRKAVEVAERYADGKATDEELHAAHASAHTAYVAVHAAYRAARAADDAAYDAYAVDAASAADFAARASTYVAVHATYRAVHAADTATDAAARDAYVAACDANAAAYDYVQAAAHDAADTAYAHAKAAQIKMIAELGNPFRKGQKDE